MNVLKWIGSKLFHEYVFYRLYTCVPKPYRQGVPSELLLKPIPDSRVLDGSQHECIRRLVGYNDSHHLFGAWFGGELAAVCVFGIHPRDMWVNLKPHEAILVMVVTGRPFRCSTIARRLIRYGASEMKRKGYSRLYASIWHSNRASIRAFEHAGWKKFATFGELYWRFANLRMQWKFEYPGNKPLEVLSACPVKLYRLG